MYRVIHNQFASALKDASRPWLVISPYRVAGRYATQAQANRRARDLNKESGHGEVTARR